MSISFWSSAMDGTIELAILGVLALVLALVILMVWEVKNEAKMIMDKMNEVIKAIKDENEASSAKGQQEQLHWPQDENETDVSSTEDQVRLSEISTPDLTPAQLERRGMYRMRAWIRHGMDADVVSPTSSDWDKWMVVKME